MKFIVFVAFGLLAVASAIPVLSDDEKIAEFLKDGNLQRAYEEELRELLEKFRAMMEIGYEPLNIPILAPYHRETLDINVNSPPTANIGVHFKEFLVSGLNLFRVNKINLNLIPIRMDFDIVIPEIIISAPEYILDGSIMDQFKLFGNGTFDMRARNFAAKGSATIVIRNGFLFMSKFVIDLNMESLKSDVQGLLGGGEVSIVMNEIMQELIPSVLATQTTTISNIIGKIVMDFVNPHLTKLTLNDVINIITGNKPM